jgi:ABC-type uncharacterized transport system substrate-binding protein
MRQAYRYTILLCNRQGVPVYSFNKKGVKNGAVAALASDYFLMVDRLILPMALKTMKEKVDPGTMPAGFLKENIINLNAQQIEKLKLKVPHKISRKANWILYNFVSTRSGLELKVLCLHRAFPKIEDGESKS